MSRLSLVKANWSEEAHCYEVVAGGKTVRAWYDRHIRLWTVQRVDVDGSQIGPCHYTASRIDAEREIGGAA